MASSLSGGTPQPRESTSQAFGAETPRGGIALWLVSGVSRTGGGRGPSTSTASPSMSSTDGGAPCSPTSMSMGVLCTATLAPGNESHPTSSENSSSTSTCVDRNASSIKALWPDIADDGDDAVDVRFVAACACADKNSSAPAKSGSSGSVGFWPRLIIRVVAPFLMNISLRRYMSFTLDFTPTCISSGNRGESCCSSTATSLSKFSITTVGVVSCGGKVLNVYKRCW
mmetsp:Transcript_86568/g.242487  ORF Transcript_86568/g.242487 Transcript_86568/m.242487 type:complete len:227 (-) Transcript_86568:1571-2251(-)